MKICTHYFLYFNITLLLFSCKQDHTISDIIDCNYTEEFKHDKTIRDAKKSFEINIGKHWKRELYVDTNQSRIYAADTTRKFSTSFIVDVTKFKGEIKVNDEFINQIGLQITNRPRTYIINQGAIVFKENPSYVFYSFQKKTDHVTYAIECYVPVKDSYYLLSAQINGSQKLTQNNAEIVTIFNSLKLFP